MTAHNWINKSLCWITKNRIMLCGVFDKWQWKEQHKPIQICPWESNNPQVLSALQPCLHWGSNGDLLPNLEVLRRVQSSGTTISVLSATEVCVHFAPAYSLWMVVWQKLLLNNPILVSISCMQMSRGGRGGKFTEYSFHGKLLWLWWMK